MKMIDNLLKHSTYIFLATALANIFNLLYHLFMVRNLDVANYGILNSLLAIIMIITIPALTIQMGVAKFVSAFSAKDEWPSIKGMTIRLTKRMGLIGVLIFLLITIFSRGISNYLKLPTTTPVIVMGLVASLAIIVPVVWGVFQGLQKFGALGFNMTLDTGAKLIFGILLVLIGFGATGALSALVVSSVCVILVAYLLLKKIFSTYSDTTGVNLSEIYNYFIPIGLSQLCFMSLTHFNIILVKHFFNPYEAGIYSVSSMAGRIILFLPAAIGIVMFPKSSVQYTLNNPSHDILKKSLIYTALICTFATVIFILFPQILIALFSVKDIGLFIPLSRIFAVSMIFFALLNIVIFHNLATHNLKFLSLLGLFTLLQVGGILLFHKSLSQVLYVVCLSGVLLFLLSLTTVKRKVANVC